MDSITTQQREALTAAFKAVQSSDVGVGHYLSRRIAVLDAFLTVVTSPMLQDMRALLATNRDFLERYFKPAGLDALTLEASEFVLAHCRTLLMTADDVAPIAWYVDLKALENYGYAEARK
jgi:hypothetical protein